jgi:phage terminase large subunit
MTDANYNGHDNTVPVSRVNAVLGEKHVRTLWAKARHKALYGGRGSAKSWSVATYLAVRAAEEKKRIVCARQFQNSINDSSKELIEKRIETLALRGQFDIQERVIIHKGTGSQFIFIGLERNIDSVRSLEGADIVWVEEARTIKGRSMEVLLPTIRNQDSELIWTWNPELSNDPVDYYFRGTGARPGSWTPPPRSIVTFVDYTDNPFFYQTELPHEMEALKRGNPARYRHVWLGEYDTKHESKVFTNVKIERLDTGQVPPRYGMDFGFGTDPSFVVKVYVSERRRQVYIAAEAHGRVTMDDLPAMARSVIENEHDQIRADSSQPGTIEFLAARGLNMVPAKKGPGSVKSGINYLSGFEIVIDPSCEAMREEARLYSWMTDRVTGNILSVPVDANNHGWDAVRYAVEDLSLMGYSEEEGGIDDNDGVIRLRW